MSLKDVFSNFHKTNRWNSKESVSGTGSELEHTTLLRVNLQKLMDEYKFESFLDVPCGDFNWMKEMDLKETKYIGGDIVPKLIEDNKVKFPDVDFRLINLVEDKLPDTEVIFVRDCLVHLSYENIKIALANIKGSNIKYLLTTSNVTAKNVNINNGQWRPLNLEVSPFNITGVKETINEGNVPGYGKNSKDKSLILIDVSEMTWSK